MDNNKDLPDLSPPNTSNGVGKESTVPISSTPANPNPSTEGKIISDETVVQTSTTTTPPPSQPNPPVKNSNSKPNLPPIKVIPRKYLLIAAGVLLFFLVGAAGVLGANKIFFGPTSLHFVPDTAEFYLGISVREHPQVQKLKELTEKFPGGKRITESPSNFTRELLGTPKDPFEDIVRLADEEIFLAKVSNDADSERRGALAALLNVVDLQTPTQANEKINNFKEDKQVYNTITQTFKDREIVKIELNKQGEPSQQYPLGALPLGITLPYSKGVFATTIDKFIVSSEKIDDVKQSINLSKSVGLQGILRQEELKTIKSDPEHKIIEKYFPNDYLVKFYQQKPIEPFSSLIPSTAISQSFLLGYDTLSRIEGKNFIEVNRGLVITTHDDGIRMNSVQLDWRTPENDLTSPYKISESLANRLPQTYSGIHPFLFAETKNLENLVQDQKNILKEVADRSDNRNQREAFEKAIKAFDDYNSEFRRAFGVDPEKDIFSWMQDQAAIILVAGGKNKSPESVVVAKVVDKEKAKNSITKISLPNYEAESNKGLSDNRDRTRKSNLTYLATFLDKYFVDNSRYPTQLSELVPKYFFSTTTLNYYARDPKTKFLYAYSTSNNGKNFTITANLEDGRKFTVTARNRSGTHSGTIKNTDIKPITAKSSDYKGTTVYSWPIYNSPPFKYDLYAAITDSLAILLFSDSSKSIEEIIDFEKNPSETLSSRDSWKTQFSSISEDVGGILYMEPVQLFGLWDYYKSIYADTLNQRSFEQNDIETVLRAYLQTIKSIGTVVSKERPVFTTKTFIQIEEIPADQKDKAEDALFRLLDQNKKSGYPILGIANISPSESLKKLRDLIIP